MRLTMVHDSDGSIAGLSATPADAPRAYMQMEPGQRIAEVDADIADDADPRKIAKYLEDLSQNFRVDFDAGGKLMKRA